MVATHLHTYSSLDLSVDSASLTFDTITGPRQVLDRFDMHVGAGQRIALLGPSGCGKSTVLRVLAGLQKLDAGNVHVGGYTPEELHTSGRIGMMFQQDTLLDWLSVQDNVALPTRFSKRIIRTAADALAMVGLKNDAKLKPAQLSGGMRQRVCLARLLVSAPDVLLLDEPFSALDEGNREGLQQTITELQSIAGFTQVIVTHNIEEAILMSDEVFVLGSQPCVIEQRYSVRSAMVARDDVRTHKLFWEDVQCLRSIVAGMKTASSFAVIGTIVAEWVGAQEGIGYYITTNSYYMETARMFAGIATIAIGGLAFYGAIVLIERYLIVTTRYP